MQIRSLFILLTCFALNFTSSAQTSVPDYSVKGVIIDSVGQKPMDMVTVTLKNAAKQSVKAIVTKGDGVFNFEKLPAGKYTVSVVSLGFRSKIIPADLTGSNKQADIGKILLVTVINELETVSITADKPIIKQEIDKITYDLQSDPESKGNNVLEMMRKIPLLSLDAEDNIQLKGSGNYKILINGKPSSMVDQNPKDILRSMPASSIQNIEVITNPPSKYEAEGLAGIINIITNKKVDNGYNGNVNINHRFPVGGPGGGGSFTIKSGKFGASGYGGVGTYNSPATNSTNSRITTGTNPTDLAQTFSRSFDNRYGYFGSEISFEIDTLNLITAQVGSDGGKSKNISNQISSLTNPDSVLQGYTIDNNSKNTNYGINGSINYQKGFKSNKNRLLTFSYRYTGYFNDQFNNLDVSKRVHYNTPNYNQTNQGNSSDQTFQIDYVHPLKKITVETGIKGILRNNSSDFEYESLSGGVFIPDPTRTNEYSNKQNIYGAYNSYTYNLKNWGFKGGLRLEETDIKADFVSNASQVDENYLNLIPSISINRKFKNQSSLNLGFTQRIQRPGIWQLNPFVDRSNPNFESAGNPDLRPVVADNYQLTYSKFKKGSINVGVGYTSTNNNIQRVTFFDPATNITYNNWANIGKDKRLSTNLNVNYPITKKWNLNMSGNLYYVWIEGMVDGLMTKNDGVTGYFYGGTGYRLDNGWRFNGNFNYNSPYINLQGRGSAFVGSSFSANKDIVKDKLSFSVSSSNPFSKYRTFINQSNGSNFTQQSRGQNYYRSYGLSLNYRFGKLKEEIKKNKRGINNDDTSGSSSAD
jgi:ferric enterobactin receptor